MPFRECPGFPDQERTRTEKRPGTRTGKRPRTRTQLGPAFSSIEQGQSSSGGSAPTAAAAPFNLVQLQRLVISCFLFVAGGQLFSHTFICAKVKVPILGRDVLAENRLIENQFGRFLVQIQTDLLIPGVDNKKQQVSHVDQVLVDQRVKNILRDFPKVTRVVREGARGGREGV